MSSIANQFQDAVAEKPDTSVATSSQPKPSSSPDVSPTSTDIVSRAASPKPQPTVPTATALTTTTQNPPKTPIKGPTRVEERKLQPNERQKLSDIGNLLAILDLPPMRVDAELRRLFKFTPVIESDIDSVLADIIQYHKNAYGAVKSIINREKVYGRPLIRVEPDELATFRDQCIQLRDSMALTPVSHFILEQLVENQRGMVTVPIQAIRKLLSGGNAIKVNQCLLDAVVVDKNSEDVKTNVKTIESNAKKIDQLQNQVYGIIALKIGDRGIIEVLDANDAKKRQELRDKFNLLRHSKYMSPLGHMLFDQLTLVQSGLTP
jgi:hypothetical protein